MRPLALRERAATLLLWFGDGALKPVEGPAGTVVELSIGRTASKRNLGFILTEEKKRETDFVLSRAQVEELHRYLGLTLRRLRGPHSREFLALRKRLAKP